MFSHRLTTSSFKEKALKCGMEEEWNDLLHSNADADPQFCRQLRFILEQLHAPPKQGEPDDGTDEETDEDGTLSWRLMW